MHHHRSWLGRRGPFICYYVCAVAMAMCLYVFTLYVCALCRAAKYPKYRKNQCKLVMCIEKLVNSKNCSFSAEIVSILVIWLILVSLGAEFSALLIGIFHLCPRFLFLKIF